MPSRMSVIREEEKELSIGHQSLIKSGLSEMNLGQHQRNKPPHLQSESQQSRNLNAAKQQQMNSGNKSPPNYETPLRSNIGSNNPKLGNQQQMRLDAYTNDMVHAGMLPSNSYQNIRQRGHLAPQIQISPSMSGPRGQQSPLSFHSNNIHAGHRSFSSSLQPDMRTDEILSGNY